MNDKYINPVCATCKIAYADKISRNKNIFNNQIMKKIINRPLQEHFNAMDCDSMDKDTFEYYAIPKEWKDHQRLLEYYNERFEGYYVDSVTGITYLKVRPITKTHRLF